MSTRVSDLGQSRVAGPPPSDDLCASCRKRPGKLAWGDTLAVTHGWTVKWCQICALTAQIEHAQDRAKRLPRMERKLARLLAREVRQGSS